VVVGGREVKGLGGVEEREKERENRFIDKFRMLKMYSFLFVERRGRTVVVGSCNAWLGGNYLTRIFRLPSSRCEHACYTINAKKS